MSGYAGHCGTCGGPHYPSHCPVLAARRMRGHECNCPHCPVKNEPLEEAEGTPENPPSQG